MLDCFNEGFSDEDQNVATSSQVPRVYLNFTKAHFYQLPCEPVRDMSPQVRELQTGDSCLVLQDSLSSERKRHHSAHQ